MLDNVPDTLTLAELQSVLQIGKNTALRLVHDNIITGHRNDDTIMSSEREV